MIADWIIYLVITVVLSVASYLLRPKQDTKGLRPASLEDFDFPTVGEGRDLPVTFGTNKLNAPNVVWYGDLNVIKLTERVGKTLFSSGKKVTTGYKYYVGMHLVNCLGCIDSVLQIWAGEKIAWTGEITSNGVMYINSPSLFGGRDREGGIGGRIEIVTYVRNGRDVQKIVTYKSVGDVDILFGQSDQLQNEYLQGVQGIDIPAYKNCFSMVFNQVYMGTSPYVKAVTSVIKRITKQVDGTEMWYLAKADIEGDMNPAHIIRECLVSPFFGSNLDANTYLDNVSFTAAADTLFDEGLGLSFVFDKSDLTTEDFIKSVLAHIDALLYIDYGTGKYVLKLLRDDYDIGTLTTYNEDSIRAATDFSRQNVTETPNEVIVNWRDKTDWTNKISIAQDIGSIQALGDKISVTLDFYGAKRKEVADGIAGRELLGYSSALFSVGLETDRSFANIKPGDVFLWDWSEYGIEQAVVRVLGIGYGAGSDNRMKIQVVQDVFSAGTTIFSSGTSLWVDPQIDPPDLNVVVMEVPYWIIYNTQPELLTETDVGYISWVVPTQSGVFGFDVMLKDFDSTDYLYLGIESDFTYSFILNEAMPATSALITVSANLSKSASLYENQLVLIGGTEFCKISAINYSTKQVTLNRGCLDTMPQTHEIGDQALFYDQDLMNVHDRKYDKNDTADVKFLSSTYQDKLDIADATAHPFVCAGRKDLPYSPYALTFAWGTGFGAYGRDKTLDYETNAHSPFTAPYGLGDPTGWASSEWWHEVYFGDPVFDYVHVHFPPEVGSELVLYVKDDLVTKQTAVHTAIDTLGQAHWSGLYVFGDKSIINDWDVYVDGTLTPDCTGPFIKSGVYGGENTYINTTHGTNYALWFGGVLWYITTEADIGNLSALAWRSPGEWVILGSAWTPYNGAVGDLVTTTNATGPVVAECFARLGAYYSADSVSIVIAQGSPV